MPAGIWILIDEIDIPVVQTSGWVLNFDHIRGASGKYEGQYLHRIIAERMGLDLLNETDHRDCNPLNNQRFNLRPATHSQNLMNRKIRSDNTSGFKGVSWHKITQNGGQISRSTAIEYF